MNQTADPDRLLAAHQHAIEFYRGHLEQASLRGEPRTQAYLAARGIAVHTAFEPPWTLGYAPPGWTRLRDQLRKAGFTDTELLAAGLITTARNGSPIDVFRDRLIFPIRRPDGQVVAFTGRDLSGRPDTAKYRNTTTTAIYQKHRLLYGLAEQLTARPPPAAVLLVEGPADAYAIAILTDQAKRSNERRPYLVIAPCGTAITAEQIALLAENAPAGAPLVVAFDGDRAGRAATEKGYPVVRAWPGPVEGIRLPDDIDPAELVASHPADALQCLDQARRPLIDLLIDQRLARYRLDEIPGRFAALNAIAPLVGDAAANDTDHAARLLVDLASRLDVHPLSVFEAVYPSDDQNWIWDTEPPASPADDSELPDREVGGHTYAVAQPESAPATARVEHDPTSGRTAWAVAEGVTDTPQDRQAAQLAVDVAARAALLVDARHAIEIARIALNTHFDQPGAGRGDAAITVLTISDHHEAERRPGRCTIAWAGDIRAYGATPNWFASLTTGHTIGTDARRANTAADGRRTGDRAGFGVGTEALTASVRGGPIGVNHIALSPTQIVIAGRALTRASPADVRAAANQRRPADAVARLLSLATADAAAVVVRPKPKSAAKPTAPQLARQAQTDRPARVVTSDIARRPAATTPSPLTTTAGAKR